MKGEVMNNKKIFVIVFIIFTLILVSAMHAQETGKLKGTNTSGTPLQGGDINRNPALGLNFMGGVFYFGAEFEIDIGLSKAFSLAPRLGLNVFGWFSPGISIRFAIPPSERPHGFWAGPAVDFVFARTVEGNPHYVYENDSVFIMGIGGEFGYKYTFDFGFYCQALIRLGFYFGSGVSGFYATGGIGLGYAF
jgi:hypothetical protein